jgi:hypothetical protein
VVFYTTEGNNRYQLQVSKANFEQLNDSYTKKGQSGKVRRVWGFPALPPHKRIGVFHSSSRNGVRLSPNASKCPPALALNTNRCFPSPPTSG